MEAVFDSKTLDDMTPMNVSPALRRSCDARLESNSLHYLNTPNPPRNPQNPTQNVQLQRQKRVDLISLRPLHGENICEFASKQRVPGFLIPKDGWDLKRRRAIRTNVSPRRNYR
jgi:hypothetical protein